MGDRTGGPGLLPSGERRTPEAILVTEGVGLTAEAGGEGRRFPCHVDLALAREWIGRINASSSVGGKPIHRSYALDGRSLWPAVQHALFEDLKILTRYAPLVAWLEARGVRKVSIRGGMPGLEAILLTLGFEIAGGRRSRMSPAKEWALLALRTFYFQFFFFLWRLRARWRSRPVLVYTSDVIDSRKGCDFRFEKAYEYLRQRGIPFYECFHTGDLRKSIAGRWKARKIAWTLEAAAGWFPARKRVDWEVPKAEGLPATVAAWWAASFRRFRAMAVDQERMARRLARELRVAGVKALLSMDDFRSNIPLLVACEKAGVRTVLIQHGLLTGYHLGWVVPGMPETGMPPVGRFLVHSPFWVEVLRSHSPWLAERAVPVTGWSQVASMLKAPAVAGKAWGRMVVLLLYETLWPDFAELRAAMAALLGAEGVEIWFKVRPDAPVKAQVAHYFEGTGGFPARIVKELDQAVLDAADVALGSHSSLMYQLAAACLPLVKLETSYAFGDQLTAFGLAEPWKPGSPFRTAAEKAAGRSRPELEAIRGRFLPPPGTLDFADRLDELLREAGVDPSRP